jgi:hypothetical protein
MPVMTFIIYKDMYKGHPMRVIPAKTRCFATIKRGIRSSRVIF